MGANLSLPDVQVSADRIYLVTGGNSGIGYCTAKYIAKLGGHVIIACRNVGKAEAAIKQMQEEYEKEFKESQAKEKKTEAEPIKLNVEQMELDLASFAKTMKFIEDFKARGCKLNVLICNAGISMPEKVLTEDGYETDLQANYLSHLLIILHFLPLLQSAGDDSRVVQVSSEAHNFGKVDLKNLNAEQSFSQIRFYSNSKLYQVMSMYWLTRHLKDKSVSIVSIHPGFVKTQMTQQSAAVRFFAALFSRNADDGAATSIKAAIDPSLAGVTGIYMADCKPKSTSNNAKNVELQDQLMTYSLDALDKYLPDDIKQQIEM